MSRLTKKISFVIVFMTFVLTTFVMFTTTERNFDGRKEAEEKAFTTHPPEDFEDQEKADEEEGFRLQAIRDFEATLEQTHTHVRIFDEYPKDLLKTRKLLGRFIKMNNTRNGVLKQPSIYVKRFERLGNNIFQLSNAIYFAEIMNVSTIYIENDFCYITKPFTTSKGIRVVPTDEIPKESLVLHRNAFDMYIKNYCPENRVYEFANETLKSIPPVKTTEKELYIHIRSGDIFKEKPCPYYGQPPLCFYESIIEKWGFKKVYILTEDTRNPVIGRLIEKYNAKLLITDLPQTIGYIVNARNLVLSIGTFLPALLKLVPADPEKRIFRYGNGFSFNMAIWNKFYFTEIGEGYNNNIFSVNWNNTAEQREMMLNETCGEEWKVSMYTQHKSG